MARPNKGPRSKINLWMDPDLKQAGARKAAATGVTLTDYISLLVQRDTSPVPSTKQQEGLPFADVA